MNKLSIARFTVVVCLCLAAAGIPSQVAQTAPVWTYTVNSFTDGPDYVTNGVCSVGAITGGPCTLRAAIQEASPILSAFYVVIELPAGTYLLSIPPDGTNDTRSGDLDIPNTTAVNTITIVGVDAQPAVIDANQLDQVFDIGPGVHIVMENVVIRGGYLLATEPGDWGAGIQNSGILTLNGVVIEDNQAVCGLPSCDFGIPGGAVSNNGQMDIYNSTIQNNSSPKASALHNASDSSSIQLRYSTLTGNSSPDSLIVSFGSIWMINSTLSGNTSSTIENWGQLLIQSSTLVNTSGSAYFENMQDIEIKDTIAVGYRCYSTSEPTWTSRGYNIYSIDDCPRTGFEDIVANPLLGPLSFWGGTTMTMPLLSHSPALDHRDSNCTINVTTPLKDDQRHESRSDGECDTGAFEGVASTTRYYFPVVVQ